MVEGTPSCCWGRGERREGKDEGDRMERGTTEERGRKGGREKMMKNGERGIRGKREV